MGIDIRSRQSGRTKVCETKLYSTKSGLFVKSFQAGSPVQIDRPSTSNCFSCRDQSNRARHPGRVGRVSGGGVGLLGDWISGVPSTRWTTLGSFPPNLGGNVTKFAPHKALHSCVRRQVDF